MAAERASSISSSVADCCSSLCPASLQSAGSERRLFAGGRRPPLSRSRRKAAFVIYHGELDESVPVSAGRNAHQSLEQAGHVVEIHIEAGGTGNPGHHEMNEKGIRAIWNFFVANPMKPLER